MSSAIESGLVIESFDMLASRPVIWPWKFRLVTWPGRDGLGRGSHAGRFAGSTSGHRGLLEPTDRAGVGFRILVRSNSRSLFLESVIAALFRLKFSDPFLQACQLSIGRLRSWLGPIG